VVAEYAARDERVRLIDNPRRIVTTALNLGFGEAQGDVVMRLDAHGEYAPDYVAKCLEVLEETGAGNAGGAARPVSDGSFMGDLIKAVHQSPFGIGAASFRRADVEGWVDTVWPGAYRREALEQAGMFVREDLPRSEDIELNSRIRAAGWGIYQSPKIVAYYHPRRSIAGLLRQNYGNGEGVVHTLRARLGGVSLRHLAPLVFVVLLAAGFAVGPFWAVARVLTGALLVIYLTGAVLFGLRTAWRRPSLALCLPVACLLLHVSYGLGSIGGLLTRPSGLAPRQAADAAT
jgi:hypothetical protein